MITELQDKVIRLSLQLPDVMDSKAFENNYCDFQESCSEMAWEMLYYNNSFWDGGRWIDDDVNELYYHKIVVAVGDFICLRIAMISNHYELPDWDNRNIVGDMSEEEVTRMMNDADCDDYEFGKVTEVAQIWFTPDGHIVQLAAARLLKVKDPRSRNHSIEESTCFCDGWDVNADAPLLPVDEYEVNVLDSNVSPYFQDSMHTVVVESLVRNAAYAAFRNFISSHGCLDVFCQITRAEDPVAVTLDYWGYSELWSQFIAKGMASAAARYYHTIKVAHRNGFDASTPERQRRWMELLGMIDYCCGNIQDPRNFMPQDFEAMYAYWQQRKANKIRIAQIEAEKRRKELEELRRLSDTERREREDLDYQQRRGIMRSLVIGNDKMVCRVIQDVTEFYEEGVAQGFCIYNCRYFTFPDMLCFTVRDVKTDKRLSTVTYDMRHEIIEANLTKGDQVPEMFDEIEELILSHKDIIRQLWQSCPDFIRPSESGLAAQRDAHKWNLDNRHKEEQQKVAIRARREAKSKSSIPSEVVILTA